MSYVYTNYPMTWSHCRENARDAGVDRSDMLPMPMQPQTLIVIGVEIATIIAAKDH